jgi:hypothetical protein
MGERNSPYFAQGQADGEADTELGSGCAPLPPENYDGDKRWSSMYRRGYASTYNPAPCWCDGSCKKTREVS